MEMISCFWHGFTGNNIHILWQVKRNYNRFLGDICFYNMKKNIYLVFVGVILFIFSFSGSAGQNKLWRLGQGIGSPDWLKISINHRTRYETLDGQYRLKTNDMSGSGGDQAVVFRTLVHARADLDYFTLGAEIQDSRIAQADSGTATGSNKLTTTIVNPLELLQAYLEASINNAGLQGSQGLLRLGRITMNVGSRRLVARNRFRNTINAFTGVDWQWQYQDKTFRTFYTLPIERRVVGDIRNNNPRFDSEDTNVRFWGVYYSQGLLSKVDKGEAYVFGLNKEKQKKAIKNLELYTFGLRLWRKPVSEQFDYQLESVYQLGQSGSSSNPGKTLDHWAYFQHAELGYRFNAPWSPRLIAQYDVASGDDNPNDGQNNRFNTLFGARRFDFGPTSIYGAFARSNLQSPALRLKMEPSKTVKSMFALRGFWRASTADSWTTAGIKGDQAYIGTQIEARLRWEPVSDNLRFEAGVAHLFSGKLMVQAGKGDVTYLYTQATVKF